jgi:long-chain acyl-CoA synthetase
VTTPTPGPDLLDAARAAARLSKQLELALNEVDLTLPQYRALVFIARGTRAPSVLAGQLAVSRPTITALIDGLVARGYVERHPDPDDGRRVQHRLTTDGEGALTGADAAVAERLGSVLDRLAPRDQERAVHGLVLWSRAIEIAVHGSSTEAAPR